MTQKLNPQIIERLSEPLSLETKVDDRNNNNMDVDHDQGLSPISPEKRVITFQEEENYG